MLMSARLFKTAAPVEFMPFTLPNQWELPGLQAEAGFAPAPEPRSEDDAVGSGPESRLVSEVIIQQARAEAAQLSAEAAQLVAEARARVAQIEQQARESGLAEARTAFQLEVNAAADELRQQLATTLDELAGLRSVIAAQLEAEMVRLALEIARKVVQREVTVDPDIPIALARLALQRFHRTDAKVRLHPDDYEYVNRHQAALNAQSAIQLIADPSVGRGGCIVQTERGEIDARLESQFANIERGIL